MGVFALISVGFGLGLWLCNLFFGFIPAAMQETLDGSAWAL